MDYQTFLASKSKRFQGEGFACDVSALPSAMFAWQQKIVQWACKKGRAALWADTGLGKTIMQLAWADQVEAEGTFHLEGLLPGAEYQLEIETPGHASASVEKLRIKAGETLKLPALRLPLADQELGGVVVDPRGKPVPEVRVLAGAPKADGVAYGPSRSESSPFTDALGKFHLTNLPRGIPKFEVVARRTVAGPDGDDDIQATVEAEVGRKDVKIVLPDPDQNRAPGKAP